MLLEQKGARLTLIREAGDLRMTSDSHLLYQLKKALIKLGYDVIKKRMWKDGHMVSDEEQYIRSRDTSDPGAFYIYDHGYVTRDAAQEFNQEGKVTLQIVSAHQNTDSPQIIEDLDLLSWMPPER